MERRNPLLMMDFQSNLRVDSRLLADPEARPICRAMPPMDLCLESTSTHFLERWNRFKTNETRVFQKHTKKRLFSHKSWI